MSNPVAPGGIPGAAAPPPARPPASIRLQIAAALAGVSLLGALSLVPVAKRQLDASFETFERAYAAGESQRLALLLREDARELQRAASDYAYWDETVAFIAGRSPGWLAENFADDVFGNFVLERAVIVDRRLATRGARSLNERDPPVLRPLSALERPLCNAAIQRREALYRFALDGDAPRLLVCAPVHSPSVPGPVTGALLWVAPLDARRTAALRGIARFPFSLTAPSTASPPAVRVEADVLHAWIPVRNWDGSASMEAHLRLERPLGPQRELALRVVLLLLLAALVVPPLLALVLLDVFVVQRIRRVSQWVRGLRLGGPAALDARLREVVDGRAGFVELQMLATDIAALAGHLEASRAGWQQEAMRDSMTGLGNRARLLADLRAHLEDGARPVGLLLVDLDGFKSINDILGHPAGDALLREVASRLEGLVPANASAYRLGGDEFAVVLAPADDDALDALADELSRQLRFVRQADGRPLVVTASTGVASAGPAAPRDLSALLTDADVAMFDAKRMGRGTWRRASDGVRSQHREQIEVASALRGALAAGRLDAWFQPIVAAEGGALLALEALGRWTEPGWGPVSPERFIPVAERAGLVAQVDLAVLDRALAAFTALHDELPALRLHANVSPQSLAEPTFAERCLALLATHGVAASALTLEITEGDLAVRHAQLESALEHLRARGVQLAIDDFGVGASSLARLGTLKPEVIKIDGSFVQDLDGDGGRICRVIVELARELGLQCVAEYVETDAQGRGLAAMGCQALQGFGPGAPMPADALPAWRARSQARTDG